MPDRSPRVRAFLWSAVAILALVVAVLSVIGFTLRERVVSLEAGQREEKLATRTAAVATCYATARSRPGLIVVLNLVASLADDSVERQIVKEVIDGYRLSAPTIAACDKRAVEAGFKPTDFPPVNRGEEGNGR